MEKRLEDYLKELDDYPKIDFSVISIAVIGTLLSIITGFLTSIYCTIVGIALIVISLYADYTKNKNFISKTKTLFRHNYTHYQTLIKLIKEKENNKHV